MNRRLALVVVVLVVAVLTAGGLYRLKSRELALEQARVAESQTLLATQKEVARQVEALQTQKADLQSQIDRIEGLKDAPPVSVYLEAAAAAGRVQSLEIQGDRVEVTVADENALQRFTAAIERRGFTAKVTPLSAPEASPKSVRASVVLVRAAIRTPVR